MSADEVYSRVKAMNFYDLVSSVYMQLKQRITLGSKLPLGICPAKEWFNLLHQTLPLRGRTFEQYRQVHEAEANVTLSYLELILGNKDYGVTLSA